MWKQVGNVGEFLAEKGSKRSGPHRMTKQIVSWWYCANCGLIALKNDVSCKAVKAKCIWED